MKRIQNDVSRWNIYLHRRARGLPSVDDCDDREVCFADELFEDLYSGGGRPLPEGRFDPKDVEWAKSARATLEAKVDLKALATACRGNTEKAAQATREALLAAFPDAGEPGSGGRGRPSGTTRDAADGLAGVGFDNQAWSGKWKGDAEADARARSLADRLKHDERLKRIALLAGKFKALALTTKKTRVRRASGEIADVVLGDDLARLLPTELARLASPRRRLAALRDLVERKCLQYRTESVERLGRGPVILCVDKSGSMEGDKDVWACAVTLALMDVAHREHRTFILLAFNNDVFHRVGVRPGRPIPEGALLIGCGGGTNISKVLDLAVHAAESKAVSRRADIVLVTDGQSDAKTAPWIRERAKARGVEILGVGIGVPGEALSPWCDEVAYVEDVTKMDAGLAGMLFGR